LDHDRGSGAAEVSAHEHGVDCAVRLLGAPAHDHALSHREAVRLDRDLTAALASPSPGWFGVAEGLVLGGRDSGRLHDLLGEVLAALDPAGSAVRSEDEDAAVAQGVSPAGRDRALRTVGG